MDAEGIIKFIYGLIILTAIGIGIIASNKYGPIESTFDDHFSYRGTRH